MWWDAPAAGYQRVTVTGTHGLWVASPSMVQVSTHLFVFRNVQGGGGMCMLCWRQWNSLLHALLCILGPLLCLVHNPVIVMVKNVPREFLFFHWRVTGASERISGSENCLIPKPHNRSWGVQGQIVSILSSTMTQVTATNEDAASVLPRSGDKAELTVLDPELGMLGPSHMATAVPSVHWNPGSPAAWGLGGHYCPPSCLVQRSSKFPSTCSVFAFNNVCAVWTTLLP